MDLRSTIIATAALAFTVGMCKADTVLSFDFDTTNSEYKYGYTYSEFGSGSHDNGVFSPTPAKMAPGAWWRRSTRPG